LVRVLGGVLLIAGILGVAQSLLFISFIGSDDWTLCVSSAVLAIFLLIVGGVLVRRQPRASRG